MKNRNYLQKQKQLRILLEHFLEYFIKFVEENEREHEVYSIYKDDITFHMALSGMRNQLLITASESRVIEDHLDKHRIIVIPMFQRRAWRSKYNLRVDVLKIRIWKLKKLEYKFSWHNQLYRNYKAFVMRLNRVYVESDEPNLWI